MSSLKNRIGNLRKRWKACLSDRLRYWPGAQLLKATQKSLRCRFKGETERLNAAAHILRIRIGAGKDPKLSARIAQSLKGEGGQPNIWFRNQIGWTENLKGPKPTGAPKVFKSLILKAPQSDDEKGVMTVWFENNIISLLMAKGIDQILKKYHIIFASSWSPPTFQTVWPMVNYPGGEFSLMLSNPKDEQWFGELVPGAQVLPFYMSSWIAKEDFSPKPSGEKDIDLLMVANWAPFKRHWVLFRALKDMSPDLRIVLVGQPDSGRTVEDIKQLADAYGVPQKIDYRNRLSVTEVNRLQERSHSSVIFSKREGSCVVVAESMMADCPVGLLKDAHIGSSAFINEKTGRFLDESNLASDLESFISDAKNGAFGAREWAIKEIECRVSSARLNDLLKSAQLEKGRPWTKDLEPFVCRLVPRFLDHDAKKVEMQPLYDEMKTEFGVEID